MKRWLNRSSKFEEMPYITERCDKSFFYLFSTGLSSLVLILSIFIDNVGYDTRRCRQIYKDEPYLCVGTDTQVRNKKTRNI